MREKPVSEPDLLEGLEWLAGVIVDDAFAGASVP
jgi:hypothetical protein